MASSNSTISSNGRLINALFRIDPTQGFVEYVQTVKPYHTKIVETLVEFVWTEAINVSVIENWDWEINITTPPIPTTYDCGPVVQILSSDSVLNTFVVPGNYTTLLVPGSTFNVVNSSSNNKEYSVTSSSYLAGNTTISVSGSVLTTTINDGSIIIPGTVNNVFYIKGVVTGPGGSWTVAGNHAALFNVGRKFLVGKNIGGGNGDYTVVLATNVGANTVITVVESIPSTATPHGTIFRIDASVDFILDSDPATNSFLIQGSLTDKYFEGSFVFVDNSYIGKNNGNYIVQYTAIESGNTRVWVKERFYGPKPISNPHNGTMMLTTESGKLPPYCRLATASNLHSDVLIHEHIKFDMSMSQYSTISSAIQENNPRGWGVSVFGGDPFGTLGMEFPNTAPATGILLLPTGLDGELFDIGGVDESYAEVVHFYGLAF